MKRIQAFGDEYCSKCQLPIKRDEYMFVTDKKTNYLCMNCWKEQMLSSPGLTEKQA